MQDMSGDQFDPLRMLFASVCIGAGWAGLRMLNKQVKLDEKYNVLEKVEHDLFAMNCELLIQQVDNVPGVRSTAGTMPAQMDDVFSQMSYFMDDEIERFRVSAQEMVQTYKDGTCASKALRQSPGYKRVASLAREQRRKRLSALSGGFC